MSSIWNPDSFQSAWQFASAQHEGQRYAAPEGHSYPYIHHIAAVAMEVASALQQEEGKNADLAIQCALLHDTIEDTAASFDDVAAKFGSDVANGVQALSKDDTISDKQAKMQDSLARILEQPSEVAMVKLADRVCNLGEPPAHWDSDRRRQYRDEALLILQRLSGASIVLSARLQVRIAEYSRYI